MNDSPSPIICATDFSTTATAAATVAAKLALRHGEKLLLVHVAETPVRKTPAATSLRLDNEADRLRSLGAEVEPHLLHSVRPPEAMLACIRAQAPSMVVVGGRIKGALDRWAFGSFSEQIAEASPVPTLVVRNPAAFEAWDWMKSRLAVLLALDFTSSSDAVLRWTKKFQRVGPCDFVACHVNYRLPKAGETLQNPDALQTRLERALRKKVRDQTGNDTMPVVVRPNYGDAGPALTEVATERGVQLIAVGAHQRKGVHRLAQFSVSRDVLHQATVNVMCIPVTTRFDGREAHIPEFRRVLVATDLSELGNTAVPFAFGACAVGGLVKVVHVVSLRKAKQLSVLGKSELRAQLRELIPDESGVRGQSAEVQIVEDNDFAAGICDEARRFDADIVCLASHGMGYSRALQGSVAKAVLRKLRRPVLLVRRPD